MTCEAENIQQVCEKIEPKLAEILLGFRKVLQEHGISEFAVVSFRLDDSAKLDEFLENNIKNQALRVCTIDCGQPSPCLRPC